jgi:aerobic-type carbon monoxide dehydrogenase small subunit (CoxS/CutS family)
LVFGAISFGVPIRPFRHERSARDANEATLLAGSIASYFGIALDVLFGVRSRRWAALIDETEGITAARCVST